MATLNSHGLEPIEESVMDAWDAADSVDAIARQLGLPVHRVAQIVANFSENKSDRWAYRVPAASAKLAQAIAAATC